MVSSVHIEPVSRTDQYKRVMKPLLERKRRARINRCLDELRDLLVAALQAEGETVTRLEKADILELTVRHVRRLNERRRLSIPQTVATVDPRQDAYKFKEGFIAAAGQVQSFLRSHASTLEPSASSRLIGHLQNCATAMSPTVIPNNDMIRAPVQAISPASVSPQHPSMDPRQNAAPSVSPSLVPSGHPVMDHRRSPIQKTHASPVSLVDLSTKSRPVTHKIVAPTPVRREVPAHRMDPSVPQDLTVKRHKPDDSKDAWRPW